MFELILQSDRDFCFSEINSWIESNNVILPSEWIEKNRYLEKDISPISGYYSFDTTPFWREPLDLLSPLSNIQKVVVAKGVQVGFTTSILENFLAYNIGCHPKPQMYITADEELLKTRFTINTERLIDSCGIRHLIFSQSESKTKKTGDVATKKEYKGGYLIGTGAGNPNKLRSMSFPVILIDEIDAFKDTLKKDGSPESIAENRSNAYGETRKILYGSTPLVMQSSKIWKLFLDGDQRYFNIPCIYCNEMQHLEWHGINENGIPYGIIFSIKDGQPLYETVAYKCKYCGGLMKNHHKSIFLNKGEWRPTAIAKEPNYVSYHLNSLYSPPGMFSWEKVVMKWKDCWDLEKNKLKDIDKYKEFVNLMQGKPFREGGEQIRREKVQQFRNYKYLKNQINNIEFIKDSGSPILFLTASVDCQKNNLFIHIVGWCEGGRNYMIDFLSIDGIVENYNSIVWKKLDEVLTQGIWISDDGKEYKIIHTCIDSGHYTDYVYHFTKQYSSGVVSIKGKDYIEGGLTYKEFSKVTLEKAGLPIAYHINTTKNKDRISKIFNLQWETGKIQPEFYPNFPDDTRDDLFSQFEAEEKINEYDKITNKWIRSRWRLIPGRENHLFDCYSYNIAGLEMLADYVCREYLGIKYLDWKSFWNWCKEGYFYKYCK